LRLAITIARTCQAAGGARVSGEFNSPILQEAEQEGYQVLRKPLEPAKLHALLSQWASSC